MINFISTQFYLGFFVWTSSSQIEIPSQFWDFNLRPLDPKVKRIPLHKRESVIRKCRRISSSTTKASKVGCFSNLISVPFLLDWKTRAKLVSSFESITRCTSFKQMLSWRYSGTCKPRNGSFQGQSLAFWLRSNKDEQWMCSHETDCEQNDTRLWKHYLPLRSVMNFPFMRDLNKLNVRLGQRMYIQYIPNLVEPFSHSRVHCLADRVTT